MGAKIGGRALLPSQQVWWVGQTAASFAACMWVLCNVQMAGNTGHDIALWWAGERQEWTQAAALTLAPAVQSGPLPGWLQAHHRRLGPWSVWVVLLFLLLCLFYLVLYVVYNMYER